MAYNREQAIENVKLLTMEKDIKLVTLLVKKAEQNILDFCGIDELKSEMSDVVEDVASYRYNLIGAEGITSNGIGSNSVTFNQDLPIYIKSRLVKYRQIKVY